MLAMRQPQYRHGGDRDEAVRPTWEKRLSPRIVALKEILGMLRPEPERPAPLSPQRHYEPPSKGRYRRRR